MFGEWFEFMFCLLLGDWVEWNGEKDGLVLFMGMEDGVMIGGVVIVSLLEKIMEWEEVVLMVVYVILNY